MRRGGFTVLELLVSIGIIGLLMGILLPAMEHVRHQAYIDKCASNLRQIGQALAIYANENRGALPRTTYVPGAAVAEGINPAAPDPFAPGGPLANDVTTPLYLLLVTQKLPPELVICPYNDEAEFTPDRLAGTGRSNFTDFTKNLGYSFANPYPSAAASAAGFSARNVVGADFAVASDLNPGKNPAHGSDVTVVTPAAPSGQMKQAISRNHERDGMNVLYGDGHVSWQTTPFCGANGDNIFTNKPGQIEGSPADGSDSVLLPEDR